MARHDDARSDSRHLVRRRGAVLAAAAVVIAGVLALRSRGVPRFRYIPFPLSEQAYATLAARPGWSARSLEVAPGVRLRGLIRKPASAGGPWVLFFPGNSDSQLA